MNARDPKPRSALSLLKQLEARLREIEEAKTKPVEVRHCLLSRIVG